VLRIAHRGYAAAGKENTLSAIARAAELGCDVVEIDVRRRKDGVLVLHHDDGDRPGAPTLVHALELLHASNADANLDLKGGLGGSPVIEAVQQTGMLGRTTCTGGSWQGLADLQKAEPGIRAGLTVPRHGSRIPKLMRSVGAHLARRQVAHALPSLLQTYSVDLVTVNHLLVDRRVVEAVHGAGGEIWCWTVDGPRELRRLAAAGVDGICSDRPASHGLG
jgi:glycerophosphoryl diester phosphodiesterase